MAIAAIVTIATNPIVRSIFFPIIKTPPKLYSRLFASSSAKRAGFSTALLPGNLAIPFPVSLSLLLLLDTLHELQVDRAARHGDTRLPASSPAPRNQKPGLINPGTAKAKRAR
jgi:hypothetical protein